MAPAKLRSYVRGHHLIIGKDRFVCPMAENEVKALWENDSQPRCALTTNWTDLTVRRYFRVILVAVPKRLG